MSGAASEPGLTWVPQLAPSFITRRELWEMIVRGEAGGGEGQLGKDVNSIINTCSFVYCSLLAVFLYWKHHKKKEGQVLNKPQMRLL